MQYVLIFHMHAHIHTYMERFDLRASGNAKVGRKDGPAGSHSWWFSDQSPEMAMEREREIYPLVI